MVSRRIDLFDEEYPARLRALPTPPAGLWARGALPPGPGVAVVGTRSPSAGGAAFAAALAERLARRGVVVWSGGAAGVDEGAHEGALRAGGPTVLVAGGGLERPYPRGAEALWRRVLDGGALLSLVPDEHPPARWTFLARNAVLAAMTEATVLVECPLKSGARSTAAAARRVGKAVWIAAQPPWSPFIDAVREEIRLGARLLLHPDELLASLPASPPPAPPPAGSPREKLLALLQQGPAHIDRLCETLGLTAASAHAEALSLVIEGVIVERSPGVFSTHHAEIK